MKIAAFLFASFSVLVYGQTPAAAAKSLMREPLGETSESKMSLFTLTLSAGASAPSHQHAGAVFAYVLQGELENQIEPEPPKVFKAGSYFHERPKQVHRIFKNLSATEPVKILIFQNTATLPPGLKPLLQEPLTNTANQEVLVTLLTRPPGAVGFRVHQHPGPVFVYILKGEVENQVDPDPPKIYRAGDVFYEPPMHVHRFLRNVSKTDTAEILVFQVGEKGKPLSIGVEEK